jgi:HopA1 effector protein family
MASPPLPPPISAESLYPGLNTDLCRFLDSVWSNRVSGPTGRRTIVRTSTGAVDYHYYQALVYRLYSRTATLPSDVRFEPMLGSFLKTIFRLNPRPEIQCERTDHLGQILEEAFGGHWIGNRFCTLSSRGYEDVLYTVTCQDRTYATEIKRARKLFSNTFYHCCLYPSGAVTHRVYLNVHPQFTAQVFSDLVGKWNTVFKQLVSNMKAAAPANQVRADSIILYVSSRDAATAIGVYLTRYQEQHVGCFAQGIPRTTEPLLNLIGVGVGAEPTRRLNFADDGAVDIVDEGGGSFGSLRSHLIALALLATLNADEDKRNFVRRVVQNFKVAKINPSEPWEQD